MKYSQAIVTLTKEIKVYQTFCRMCGADAEELVLGEVYRYLNPETGKLIGLDHPGGWLSQYLLDIDMKYDAEVVPNGERLPTENYCSDCQAEIDFQQAQFRKEVEDGGVRWTCSMCIKSGIVVAHDSQGFSKAVREQMDVPPPDVVTVKFNNCEQHEAEDDPLEVDLHIH